jgi:hypothetical protein
VTGVSPATVTLRGPDDAAVAVDVAYDAASGLATVRPSSQLALSATYTLAIGEGIIDEAARPLTPVSWRFNTRIDADPLGASLSVTLEAGSHILTRFADDGTVTETRTVEVIDRRWLLADRRARLPGQVGSWLHLEDPALGGWWVAESPVAHGIGLTEEATLRPGTTVTLSRAGYPLLVAGAAPEPSDAIEVGPDVTVTVDARRVTDGHTFLRLAETRTAGTWIEVDPRTASTEAASQRILSTEVRTQPGAIVAELGDHAAYRFDAAGRVLDRRSASLAPTDAVTTRETILIGGGRYAVVADGELAGWALPESAAIRVIASAAVAGSARE